MAVGCAGGGNMSGNLHMAFLHASTNCNLNGTEFTVCTTVSSLV